MRMRALVSGLVLMLAAVQALAASDVQSVRLWRAPDNTRLVFDLSGPVQHNVFTLTAPDRIVIDVNGGNLPKPFEQLALKNTPISGLRAAKFDADTLRVVIDLSAQVTPKSFTLTPNQQYGHRLVVDLYDEGADPSTTAGIPATTTPSTPAAPVSPTLPALKLPPLPSSKRDIIIAIDAGHGGEDPGAIGPGKAYEKNVVLQISKELQRQINAEKGFRAELVRTGDYFIPLRKRTEIARKKGADLFVSIHADAAPRSSAYGASVFALSDRGATSETARWLADSENRSDLIGGAGSVNLGEDQMLAGVLLDLSMTASLASSLNVGQKVLSNMGRMTRLHKSRVEQAGFMVLKSPDIPSILVETGFISNPSEARKLQTASHQQSLARSIHSGVRQFFHENPPPGTYVAWLRDSGKIASVPREHVVRSGESLALLAQRYQISLPALRSANSLKGDVIKVGQTLNIPATTLASQP
ncbi:AMIN domain-containing protein [Pseudomonas sp. MTM4]|uniref:N-acetylmuramoyl-L-alanine amidase n=1 Tax=unclassified Pseudomonas TaxID=196821 RepID=UPI001A32F62F|nr:MULTISPECIES: N-acetylmuramoyl-L-alanine amidase [unclassified Pseudomonas]MBC8651434.1 AMIN domain-containing protein [Pseudomonas sp. MT4]QXY93219.1 AMIN domain-containing protein [Pseudomonas sp. MTM4]